MTVLIIGAGHAGVQTADSLRAEGYDQRILLCERTAHLPYQRPPLSKEQLLAGGTPMPLRGASFYADAGIELRRETDVVRIDAAQSRAHTRTGETIDYDDLVIASGAYARRPRCVGADLEGIATLRTVEDARVLAERLAHGSGRVVVVGAGFIGLEFAAVAAACGLDVTVIDFAQRAMQRVLSPAMSDYFAELHAGLGIDLRFGEGLDRFLGEDGHVSGVVGTSGTVYSCDFVVVGLGVEVDESLAVSAGCAVERGIVVDDHLRTSVPHVFAVGDIAVFPSSRTGGPLRLESVQHATDSAKTLARTLAGQPTRYDAVPWFWSHQGTAKLQIAGLSHPDDTVIERGDRSVGRFSTFLFREGRLAAVESVGAPADHVAARRLLEHDSWITPAEAGDPGFDLKGFARSLASAPA